MTFAVPVGPASAATAAGWSVGTGPDEASALAGTGRATTHTPVFGHRDRGYYDGRGEEGTVRLVVAAMGCLLDTSTYLGILKMHKSNACARPTTGGGYGHGASVRLGLVPAADCPGPSGAFKWPQRSAQ